MALAFADGDRPVDAVITLGAVIRGETTHYEIVSGECARGVQDVQLSTRVPVVFGVLTVNTLEQALERSANDERQQGSRSGHDGARDGVGAAPGVLGRSGVARLGSRPSTSAAVTVVCVADNGERLYFHCVDIADGTRTIGVGERVTAERTVGHLGHDEAVEIAKQSGAEVERPTASSW